MDGGPTARAPAAPGLGCPMRRAVLALAAAAAAVWTPAALAGNGTFTEAPPVAAPSPIYVAVGDFNSDGDEDMAIVNDRDADNLAIRVGSAGAALPGGPPGGGGRGAAKGAARGRGNDGGGGPAGAHQKSGALPPR